jgi:hypothetical protein
VVVNLPDVLFEFNKSTLTSDARTKVRDIADVLDEQRVRSRQVSVEGHTDSIGGEGYNQRLRTARRGGRERARDRRGERQPRSHAGFGKKYPIAPNRTPTAATIRRAEQRIAGWKSSSRELSTDPASTGLGRLLSLHFLDTVSSTVYSFWSAVSGERITFGSRTFPQPSPGQSGVARQKR